MRNLTSDEIEFFDQNGYVVVPGVLRPETLALAREAYWKIIQKCRADEYLEYRVENQLSDDHIFGIERIFNPAIYQPDLFEAIIESYLLACTKQLLRADDVMIALNRIHCTNDFSYSGPWHRDGKAGQTDHVQSALCLYDEKRFFVVPGSHRKPVAGEELFQREIWCRRPFEGQRMIRAAAGDLLLFHSSVLHRGSCVGRGSHRRAYVHFRIAKLGATQDISRMPPPEYEANPSAMNRDPAWGEAMRNSLASSITRAPLVVRSPRQNTARGVVKKSFYRLAYYGLSFLPEAHAFFSTRPNFTPYLRDEAPE